jgi:hypothetical protein
MRPSVLAAVLAITLVSCSSDTATPNSADASTDSTASAADFSEGLTVVASSPGSVGVGPQRVLMVVASPENELLGGPEDTATATFRQDGEEWADVATEWVWGIEGVRGFYVASFDFPTAGNWEATLTNSVGSAQTSPFAVVESVVIPEVGTPAPPSETLTIDDAPIDQISTDPEPNPAFYEQTVADAVSSGMPSVIVFATPAFCTTAICGPTMEVVKVVAEQHPGANFVHVEVYEDIDDPQGELTEVPAVIEWGLQTEPWVFVVDSSGTIAARFEGAVGADELERALGAVGG